MYICKYVHVYMCTFTYVCMHMYIHVYVHMHVYMHMDIHVHKLYTCVCVCVCVMCFATFVNSGSEAAKAGITPGCCILRVEDENVLQISHDKVVATIKTLQENGNDTLSLKIGIPRVQHLTRYHYESTGDNMVEVSERVAESPYLYNVPAQVCVCF